MKRPSTASAGLNFLNEGFTIELSVQAVGAFIRYCERNKPGMELSVAYENDIAIIKPVMAPVPVEVRSFQNTLKAGLEKAGIKIESKFFKPGIRPYAN